MKSKKSNQGHELKMIDIGIEEGLDQEVEVVLEMTGILEVVPDAEDLDHDLTSRNQE